MSDPINTLSDQPEVTGDAGVAGATRETADKSDMGDTHDSREGSGSRASADPVATGLKWLRIAATVLGPATLVTALMYYYGYVSTYAQFDYFGINVELLNYSTADYVLQSPGTLFLPLLVLLLLGGAGYWIHTTATRSTILIAHPRAGRLALDGGLLVGAALLLRGVIGIVDGKVSANEFIGTTPACLGLGTLLVLYTYRLRSRTRAPRSDSNTHTGQVVAWAIGWSVATLSLFWLVNSFASAYGRGVAEQIQQDLIAQPEVVLHTKNSLVVEDRAVYLPTICERSIKDAGSPEYPYRYINLRLLATSEEDLFLVPADWTHGHGAVFVVKKSEASLQLINSHGIAPCPD